MNRFANENSSEPSEENMPRIVYPNDIPPDKTSLSEMSSEAKERVVKAYSANPR